MKKEFYKHIELDSELDELKALFDANDIVFEVTSSGVMVDEAIVGTAFFPKYTIKLLPKDFENANELVRTLNAKKDIVIDDFPHLKSLDNDELFDILENPNDWSSEAEVVAKKVLESRGVEVSDNEIKAIREKKNQIKRAGKSVSLGTQLLYLAAIVVGFYFNLILIIAGVGMGYYYAYGTGIDDRGEKYFAYDKRARNMGKVILYGGLILLLIQCYFIFYR